MWIEERRGRFLVRWRDTGGRRRSRAFDTREGADRFDPEAAPSVPVEALTLSDWVEQVIDGDLSLRGSTKYNYQRTLARWIAPTVGCRTLTEIDSAELRRYFGAVLLGPAGKASVYRLLSEAFRQAVTEGVIERSPLASIRRPRAARSEIAPLAPEQVHALAEKVAPRYRVAILLAAYAGLRPGEIGGLRVHDIDVAAGSLRIVQAVRREGGQRVLGDVKTAAGRRRVAIPKFLVEELRRHVEDFPPAPDGRIVSTRSGGIVCNVDLYKRLQEAARVAGITPAPRFHLLRHSYAALMIAQGAHPKIIASQLGHSSIQITLDV